MYLPLPDSRNLRSSVACAGQSMSLCRRPKHYIFSRCRAFPVVQSQEPPASLVDHLRLDPCTQPGSTQRQFVGFGLSFSTVVVALLGGAIETAFAEELLFRGLIGGSLSRRLPLVWANVLQGLIFSLSICWCCASPLNCGACC